MEKRAKASDEKFSKLKEVYQKLRDEHITLLRQKAEVDKKLSLSNVVLEQSNKIHSELQDCLEKTKTSLQEVTEEFTSYKTNHAKVYGDENLKLKEANEQLEVNFGCKLFFVWSYSILLDEFTAILERL